MAEKDPREYRGGVREAGDDKGGADSDGMVPRELLDDPGETTAERAADGQALGDAALGTVTEGDPTDTAIDHAGGDQADATSRDDG